jgi:hypothetical protein
MKVLFLDILLLTTAVAILTTPAAAGICDIFGNTSANTNPCIINVTSGYAVRPCVGRPGICGIQPTYTATNACNSSTQQAMLELQRSGSTACQCSRPLQDVFATAPALLQPGGSD